MAGLGNALLGLMGTKDPRQQLVAQLLGAGQPGAGSTPAGGTAPGAVVPPAGAPPAPAGPAVAEVYQSPPQLLEMYTSLQDYTNKANNVDRGIGMIAASLAQDQNRAAILNATQGTEGDPQGELGMLMQMQEQQMALAEKAAANKRAMAMAEQLGLDPETAMYLQENGQLDDMLAEKLNPKPVEVKTEVIKRADGSQFLANSTTGEVIRELSPAEIAERETEVVGSDVTGRTMIDSATGEPIRKVTKPVAPDPGITYRSMTKEEIAARGLDPTKAYEMGSNGNVQQIGGDGTNVSIDMDGEINKVDLELLKGVDEELLTKSYPAAQAATSTIQSVGQARAAFDAEGGIITGSFFAPLENEVRKSLQDLFGISDPATANTAQYEAAQADVVRNKIKELGTGNAISNADLQFTLTSIGAGGTIPEEAIPRILSIMEVGSYNTVLKHNAAIDAAIAGRGPDIRSDVKAALEAKKLPVPEISIPAEAIAELKADPSAAAEFDEIFGPGTAANLLMVK